MLEKDRAKIESIIEKGKGTLNLAAILQLLPENAGDVTRDNLNVFIGWFPELMLQPDFKNATAIRNLIAKARAMIIDNNPKKTQFIKETVNSLYNKDNEITKGEWLIWTHNVQTFLQKIFKIIYPRISKSNDTDANKQIHEKPVLCFFSFCFIFIFIFFFCKNSKELRFCANVAICSCFSFSNYCYNLFGLQISLKKKMQ